MAYILMMNVLSNFNRDELEIVSVTSRLFAKVVRHEFSIHPFRFFKLLDIHAGENVAIRLRLKNGNIFLLENGSNTQQFKNPQEHTLLDEPSFGYAPSSYCTLDKLRPFLGENVRFKGTMIDMGSLIRISNGHVAEMEVIAHLWAGQNLNFIPGMSRFLSEEYSPGISPDCNFVLSSQTIVSSCHELSIFGIDVAVHDFPSLYDLKVIRFIGMIDEISPAHLLEFIDGIGKYDSKIMTVCYYCGENPSRMHIGNIRQAFNSSLTPNPHKIIFVQSEDINEIVQFRDVNSSTGEALEMRAFMDQEKSDVCNVIGFSLSCNIYSLERKKLEKH
ncbi:hypothetical protein DdX_18535 [Ditylenchus destructor]|uniref:F-box domain-containing protein n=1 Tax=Ditylenchus destructor TaxID=166010 RepID=A0AAD4MPV9_9BILA|nr:hypothetical protein DdX_18535 [Ditylenchus destructor]